MTDIETRTATRRKAANRLATLALVLTASTSAVRAEDNAPKLGSLQVLGDPSIPTCPTSNCPAPPRPPILSTQVIHGNTSKGADQAEWLSSLGLFVKTGNPDGQKVTQYLGVMQAPGAGTAWALNTDLVRNATHGSENSFGGFEGSGKPGSQGAVGARNGSIGYELDFTNWDMDSAPGVGPFTVGQYVHAQGSFRSLSALYFDATMGNGALGWEDGILFNGPTVIRSNTFFDGTHSTNSVTVGGQHVTGLNTAMANPDLHAIVMKAGQTACFNELRNCVTWRDGKLSYMNTSGEIVFSVDEAGNATFKGRVHEMGRP